MAASRELAILITAKNMAGGVFKEVRGDITTLQSEAQRGARNFARNVGIGMAAAGVGIATQVKAGIDSLVELEEANAQTAAAIASTGSAAGMTLDDIRALSEGLERQTTIDDKLIQAGANILLTFKKVKKDAFAPALELAMDLSTRLGTDLNSSVLMVGKALEDPIRGVTALRRAGVQLNDEQVEQIKTLVEQNDLYGAQQILLQELETQVGGSAEALAEGAGGAQRKFSDAIEDMQMALAQGFLPLIEKVSEKVQDLASDPEFMDRVSEFGQTLADGFDRVLGIVEQIPWDAVASAMEITATATGAILDMFTSLPPWVQTAVITGWGLNKLTGGALGNIAGSLLGAGIKGLRGSTPATPMFVKEVGLPGGGTGGIGGGAGGAGGLTRFLALAGVAVGGVAIGAHIGTALNEGTVAPARDFAQSRIQAVLDSGDAAKMQQAIDTIEDQLNPEDFGAQIALALDINGVRTTLESELATLQQARGSLSEVERMTSEGRSTAGEHLRIAERQRSEAASADASMIAAAQRTASASEITSRKNFSPNVNVNVNTAVSINNFTRVQQSSSYARSGGATDPGI